MSFWTMLLILPISVVLYFIGGLVFSVVPLPATWSQPWKTRAYLMAMKMTGTLASVGGSLGMNTIRIARFTFDRIHPRVFSRAHLDKSVVTTDTEMNEVKVRVYQTKKVHEGKRPGLIFIHGGGYVFGSIAHSDGFVKRLVKDLDVIAISVEYRLAPEHVYPTALADCLKVIRHVMKNTRELNIDVDQVILLGEGTGGTLCSAALLKLLDDNFKPMPKLQVLLYPASQALDLQTPSYQAFKNAPLLTQNAMAFNYTLYAEGSTKNMAAIRSNQHVDKASIGEYKNKFMPQSVLENEEDIDKWEEQESPETSELWNEISYIVGHPYFSPLLARDVSKMPATYVSVAKMDVLRDDGLWLGHRLQQAGVDCTMESLECIHGWSLFAEDIDSASKATDSVVKFIKEKLD